VKQQPARRASFCKNHEAHGCSIWSTRLEMNGPDTSFQVSTQSKFPPDTFSRWRGIFHVHEDREPSRERCARE
jgi:hypothetical protein